MHDQAATVANRLGALALVTNDLQLATVTTATGLGASGASALVVLYGQGGVSVTELGRRIGLSQSASTRLVDSLEKPDLVRRQSVLSGGVAVSLTPAGREAARTILGERGASLIELVETLDVNEQRTLLSLLDKLLEAAFEQVGNQHRMCRLCDRDKCVSTDTVCPVGSAERKATEEKPR